MPFPVLDFRRDIVKWRLVETEVSPSNFILAAKERHLLPASSARRQK
jgi:hypothetical protein